MPELPEVENVRRGLEPHLAGQRVTAVDVRRPDLRFPFPADFARRLKGQRFERLTRRAKYLLAHLSGGEVLVMHLGMTGRFSIAAGKNAPRIEVGEFEYEIDPTPAHDHVVFTLASGERVTYSDPRRFGYMLLLPQDDLLSDRFFRHLGFEPLSDELTSASLAQRAAGRRADLKAFLMDQRIVAGLGNIYVCEALFRAGLSPLRPASVLATKRGLPTGKAEALVPAIKAVLEAAIVAGGSTLRDYRRADGSEGAFQHAFAVYGRAGEPCVRPGCRGMVRRTIQAGRSTFHCPVCQR